MRFYSWPEKLIAYLHAHEREPFRWGRRDCALLAWGAVEAMAGVDPGAPFRGNYTTKDEADAVIASYLAANNLSGGLSPFEQLIEHVHSTTGFIPIVPLRAQRGDLVLMDTECGVSLGVVGAMHPTFVASKRGLATYPLRRCRRAWRVG